jgi:tripartite-type tricarboxylate transporter receptor subunit TctC
VPKQFPPPAGFHCTRRATLTFLAGLGAMTARGVQAQETFPSKPIKLIVPFSTGTGSDAIARILAHALPGSLGQNVIVDNRGGAGGITGTEQGARSAPDGYTLTIGTTSTLLTNPVLNPQVKYNVEKDFAPVAGLGRAFFVVVTANTPDAPRTLKELLERLKVKAGSFGSAGVGTITHLAAEALILRAKVSATHVPYKGSGAALADVIAGHTLFATDTLAATLPLIRSGRLRALAVTAPERLQALPEVPTVAEPTGDFKGFLVDAWWGLMAPAGTPEAVLRKLGDATLATLAQPETRARLAALELEPLALASHKFGVFIREQTPFWVNFIKQSNIKLD